MTGHTNPPVGRGRLPAFTQGALILVLAGIALAVVWRVNPQSTPPLYDGLQGPVERYRYLRPNPTEVQGNSPPTSVRRVIPVARGKFPLSVIFTTEKPPQAELILQDNALRVPRSTRRLTVTIRPVSPPSVAPKDGVIEGNLYQILAVADGGARLRVKPGLASVSLRAPNSRGSPHIEQFVGGSWIRLPTNQLLGQPIYIATTPSLGDFALILTGTPSSGSGLHSWLLSLVIGALVIGLAGVGVLLVRLSQPRRQASED